MSEAKVIALRGERPGSAKKLDDLGDDDLMLLAGGGSRRAFSVLVERYHGRVTGLCANLAGPANAEEIAQDVWLRVWAHRERYRCEGKFRLYLYAIARNLSRNRQRAAHRAEDAARWRLEPEPAAGIDDLVARERRRRVQEALLLLPPGLREAVALRFCEGLPYEDICRIVGARASTVRSRVHLGLERLRAVLGRDSDA